MTSEYQLQGVSMVEPNESLLDGFERVPCQQDTEGTGYFEVFASTTGTGIGLTNLVVIAVILWGGKKLHKATFYCICNLAFADMLAGLLLLWIFSLQKVMLPFRTPEAEIVQKSIWTTAVWSSIFSQLVIAVDRYCYVTKGARGEGSSSRNRNNDKWGNTKRKRLVKGGIALTWLVPIVTFVVPVSAGWNCLHDCSCQTSSNQTSSGVYFMVCTPINSCSQVNPPFTKGSMLYLGLTLIFIPIIPCVLYAKIYHYVSLSSHKLKPSPPSFSSRDDGANSSADYQIVPNKLISAGRAEAKGLPQAPLARKTRQQSWRRRVFISRLLNKNARSQVTRNSLEKGSTRQLYDDSQHLSSRYNGSKPNFVKRSRRRDMRLLRTLIIILALLLVSTVPLGVLFIITFVETDKRYVQAAKVLLTTSLFNSMINPWIYFWRFPEMRKAIRRMFCRCSRVRENATRAKTGFPQFDPMLGQRKGEVDGKDVQAGDYIPSLGRPYHIENSTTGKDVTSSSNSAF